MTEKDLLTLIEQDKREDAIRLIREMYNTSLLESNEYLDALILKEEKRAHKDKRKTHMSKILMIGIPILLIGLVFFGVSKAIQHEKERKETIDEWYKEVYGPSNYQEAYLKISNDKRIDSSEKSNLYLELRKEEIAGTPFKETKYWKNYKLE